MGQPQQSFISSSSSLIALEMPQVNVVGQKDDPTEVGSSPTDARLPREDTMAPQQGKSTN